MAPGAARRIASAIARAACRACSRRSAAAGAEQVILVSAASPLAAARTSSAPRRADLRGLARAGHLPVTRAAASATRRRHSPIASRRLSRAAGAQSARPVRLRRRLRRALGSAADARRARATAATRTPTASSSSRSSAASGEATGTVCRRGAAPLSGRSALTSCQNLAHFRHCTFPSAHDSMHRTDPRRLIHAAEGAQPTPCR